MNEISKIPRFFLINLFGDNVNTKILEILLQNALAEKKNEKIIWKNFSKISSQAKVAKSSGKRILDELLSLKFIEEKKYETHAQNPPRFVRLNTDNFVIKELIFFYKKVRGFL